MDYALLLVRYVLYEGYCKCYRQTAVITVVQNVHQERDRAEVPRHELCNDCLIIHSLLPQVAGAQTLRLWMRSSSQYPKRHHLTEPSTPRAGRGKAVSDLVGNQDSR